MTPEVKRVLLDCDPGHDDALAIMLAAGDPRIDLVGITTVAGNQTLAKTTANACIVAAVAGLTDVPVVAGHDRPLLRELLTAPGIHGESGMDGPAVPEMVNGPRPGHAVDFIVDTILAEPGEITLVATGPLTNIASALRKAPELTEAATELVIMGGAYGPGNITPVAEFNIFVDPEAAAIVFGAPWRVTMFGLDVTHQALCMDADQERIAGLGTPQATFANDLLDFFRSTYRREQQMADPPIHDACAIAYVADPTLFEVRPATVAVETHGVLTAGMTVTTWAQPGEHSPHDVGVGVRREAFFDVIVDAIAALS